MRQNIEETLALWREAERQLECIREGEGESPAAIAREREVVRLRARFHTLMAATLGLPEGLSESETKRPDPTTSIPQMRGDRAQAISAESWVSSMAFGRSTVKQ